MKSQTSSSRATRPSFKWPIVGLAITLLLVSATLLLFKSGLIAPRPSSASHAATTLPGAERDVFAAYAGSLSCGQCHQEAFEDWKTSDHALAERLPGAALDQIAFEPGRSFLTRTQHTHVCVTNGIYEVTALGPMNRYAAFSVERVIGHDPLRQFLVKFPGGRFQRLDASYDPHRNEWFNAFGKENREPGEWGHWTGRGLNWNSMCADCHNTRVRKNYEPSTDSYRTTMAEMTVGCESCHGPLKAHNDWQKQYGKSARTDPTLTRLSRKQTMDNCGFCHARRSELTGDFKPGDDFSDQMRLAIVDESETFYPDGQVREEDYEFSAFLSSRMHSRGVTCADCHNPHSAKTMLPGNWLCMRCHNGSVTNAPLIAPVSHSHHKVFGYDTNGVLVNLDLMAYKPKELQETGGECVNCHMPQTRYMQRHWRHDHGFTIPDPLVTKQHAIPNACNRCHQDKDVDWAMAWVEQWYGSKMERPTRRRAQVIAAARAGQTNATNALLNLLATEEIPYWRAVAARLLAPWTADPGVSKALMLGLGDTNALVRTACIDALAPLAQAQSPGVLDVLSQRLQDPTRSVRLAAAWALRSNLDPSSQAGQELLHMLQLNADQPAGQMQKAAYSLARHNTEEAAQHYKQAIEWDPGSAPIRHDYALALSSLGRKAEAVAQLETACNLQPNESEYRYKLGLAWNEAGQTEKAAEALEMAVKLQPQHVRAWYNLGLALSSLNKVSEALEALSRAESADSSDAHIPYARATILARLGRLEDAKQAARRALEIQPGFPEAREILRSLQ